MKKKSKIKSPFKVHGTGEIVQCEECEEAFITEKELRQHRKIHIYCKPCGKTFHTKFALHRHNAFKHQVKTIKFNINEWIMIIECIFLSERRHNVTFHPLGIFRHHWLLMFTFLFTFLFTLKAKGGLKFEILRAGLKFGYEIGFEFEFSLEDFFKCFFLKAFLIFVE